jgi:hypothetical protein
MPTDLSDVEIRTPRDSGYVGDEDYLTAADFQKARAVRLVVVLLAVILLNAEETIRLVSHAKVNPPVVGFADNYFFRPQLGALEPKNEDYLPQFRDTVETLFRRTEKGSLPELEEFLGAGVRDYVDAHYTQMKDRYPAGFLQSFQVLEERSFGMSIKTGAILGYRGIWTVRSADGMATKAIFVKAVFSLSAASALNATGWRLTSVEPMTEDEFYAQERAAEHAQRMGLPNTPSSP